MDRFIIHTQQHDMLVCVVIDFIKSIYMIQKFWMPI